MAKIGTAEAVYSSAPSKKVKRKEAEEVVYTPLSKEEIGDKIQQDIADKINYRFTPSFSQNNAPKIRADIARAKASDEVASNITRQVSETVPIFQKENFTPSGLKSAVAKDIKDNQENRLKRTLIPSVNYDSDEAELEAIRKKRTNAFVQKEKAQKNWNNWKNSEGSALQKGLDYIGSAEVNNLRQDLNDKESEYNLLDEEYTLKKQQIAEKRIQQKYGVGGSEYIALLEQKKDNAQSDSEKNYYENEIKRTRNELYGKTNVFEHIGNIAKEGLLQYNKGVAATVDFLLGTPAKWLGFENNIFTQANKDSTRWLEEASAETYKGSQSFGDTQNLTGQFGTALIAAAPDLLLTILSGGTSKTKELGTVAIELANPTFWSTLKNEIIKTVKSPIFYTSFVRELGTNYEENIKGGANETQATLAAFFASAVTAKMEMGGFQSLGDELAETKGVWRKLYKWALSAGEEGLEEPGQTSATNLINKIVYDHDKKMFSTTDDDSVFNLKRAAKEFGIGTFVGAVLGGGQLTFSGIINAKGNSQYSEIGKAAIKTTNIQEIIDYAKSAPNDTVRFIAREVDANSISNADAGRLYQYAVTNINEKFDDIYTIEELNAVVSEYFLGDIPKAVRDIASASFANKLVEMNIEPETNEVYNRLTNNLESDSSENSQLQSQDNGDIINNNQDTGVDIDGSTNPELLAGGEISAIGGSGDGVRQQSENSRRLAGYLGTLGEAEGQYPAEHRAGESGWLFRQNNQEIEGSRNEESLLRTVSGISISGRDTAGRTISPETAKNFEKTIFKDKNGNLLSLYHWTTAVFDKFAKGEFGFHFGTLEAAHDRYSQTKEKQPDTPIGVYKEVYINMTNPFYIDIDAGRWCAYDIAYQLKQKGVITEQQYEHIRAKKGFWEYTYDNPAAKAVREILSQNGYDGIIYKNDSEDAGSYSVIALYPDQILTVAENGVLKENSGVTEADTEVPANFMPENDTSGSGEFGLSEPTDQEIYRDPTDEENREAMFGRRKNAKQRHILDVAKKLDSGIKVVFVSENAKVLSGQKGVYMRESNTMYLSESNSAVESYYQVFKHEFIHRLESKGAYQSFKNYLFKHSSAFEKYARAQLGESFKGTREEALQAFAQKYIDTVQNGSFSKAFKDGFTVEDAQYEMVADFISEVLFKGNRADVAQNLADSNLEAIFSIEDTLSEFESLSETDRTWFQKIIDAIRDFIASLKGVKQNERLVNDLEYIEKRLARVLDSKDTKKAASRAGNKQYHLSEDARLHEYIEDALAGNLPKKSFYKVNETISDRLATDIEKIVGFSVKGYSNEIAPGNIQHIENEHGANGRKDQSMKNHHDLARVSFVVDNYEKIKEGKISGEYKNSDGTKAKTIELQKKIDDEFYYVVEAVPDASLKTLHIVSAYKNKKDTFSDVPVSNDPRRYVQDEHQPNVSNDIILNEEPSVKDIISEEDDNYSETPQKTEGQFSLGSPAQQMRDNLKKYESGEITREEYLEETDRLWGKANETFGAFETGENAKAPIATPTAVAEDKPTERFTRTIIETGKLTEEMLQGMEEKVLLGDFSYEVISDEKALEKANTAINNGTAEDIWEETLNGSKITKNQMAIGERLLKDAMESGNTKRVLELSAELADIFTRAGQVVQAARLLKKMTGAGRLVSLQRTVKTLNSDLRQKYGEDMPPIKISPETAKRLAEAKTKDGIEYAYQETLQEVADQMPVTFLDKWNAWRYFAMLSNPKTHIRNIFGNAIFAPAVRIKNFIATVAESGMDQSKRTKSIIIQKEYRDFAKKDGKNAGVKNLLKGNKYNDKSALREKQRIFKSEVLEFLTRTNSNLLEAEDMWFKNKHYIHALAGFLQARKVDLGNVSQEVLDEARIYAVKEAKKATFNDESALANWIQNFGNKNLATSIAVEGVLPFKRTPINIVKRGIEYSPIGLTKTLTKGLYDVKKGKITVTEFVDGLASGLTGTGIMLVGMFLANLGWVTGGEDDDEKSQFEKWLGKQEYAVEFFGKSYTVDWAAPANIPFFVGVEIVNTLNEGEEFSLSQLSNAVWNSLEPITNLSMLSGMQGVIESARYADSAQTLSAIAVDALTSYGMQVVPSLSGAVARTIDPTQRSWYTDKNDKWLDSTAHTVKNNIQSKVPGLSYTQIPKIDMWGREVSRGGTAERVLENFASPGYYSKIEVTETSEELKRIFNETDQDVFPNIAAKSFKVGGETKHLTAQEYVAYAKAKGSYSYDYIKEFMEAAPYEKLTDKEKADVIAKLYEYANAKAKATVSDYDLMKNYKTVTQWEQNGRSAIDYYIFRSINK